MTTSRFICCAFYMITAIVCVIASLAIGDGLENKLVVGFLRTVGVFALFGSIAVCLSTVRTPTAIPGDDGDRT